MAFAAARMIMPKDKVVRKPSAEFQSAPSKNKVSWSLKAACTAQISFLDPFEGGRDTILQES